MESLPARADALTLASPAGLRAAVETCHAEKRECGYHAGRGILYPVPYKYFDPYQFIYW
jgi:hypothetical protein